ncbi:endonuclease [Mangrovactinospora gilvigrisea]|uniref:Endonuclease n=1 Tax=Mangrovactinospora gilvigrisea TaxID=1428644 RepID=A0A1J7BA56_9ACTN|nr:DUF692 domain-containing protein [Mangrovactinospora gilvigrisea]OIV35575.1 endonuclease [Mangrovactinospora gilvigrisea]
METKRQTRDQETRLGVGIGWRPEIDLAVERLERVDWVEAVAENLCPDHLPESVQALRARGVPVVPHGVSLGLGGAHEPDPGRLSALAATAEALDAPLVTEHLAFVRADHEGRTLEAGHLLPVPHTRDALEVVVRNVRAAQRELPVPLALENIAPLIAWPGDELTEAQFLAELVERTGVRLLIDVANLHTAHVNLGVDPARELDTLPLDALAYVHIAGGVERNGVWHDTHAHPVTEPVLEVLDELCRRTSPDGVLLERDAQFPSPRELGAELDAVREVLTRHPEAAGGGAAEAAPEEPPAADASRDITTTIRITTGRRDRLAERQGALLASLTTGAEAPEGFDAERLAVQRKALGDKRREVLAKSAPGLAEALDDGYPDAFASYAAEHPLTGTAREDALALARHALAGGGTKLPDDRRRAVAAWLRETDAPRRGTLRRARRVWRSVTERRR